MLWWHNRIAEAGLQGRLERLSLLVVKVYVLGCVTHAKDVLTSTQSQSAEFAQMSQVLEKLWLQYPSSLEASVRDHLTAEVAKFLPGEGSVARLGERHTLGSGICLGSRVPGSVHGGCCPGSV